MKTKTIPFDLETAKKIQAGEIEGKIKTRDGKMTMSIVCFDSTARYCDFTLPIIAQDIVNYGIFFAYFKDGAYVKEEEHPKDLVLEVPDNEPQLKPFDKVLVRENDASLWRAGFYSHELDGKHCVCGNYYPQCIPYEGNQELLGTTDKPKED